MHPFKDLCTRVCLLSCDQIRSMELISLISGEAVFLFTDVSNPANILLNQSSVRKICSIPVCLQLLCLVWSRDVSADYLSVSPLFSKHITLAFGRPDASAVYTGRIYYVYLAISLVSDRFLAPLLSLWARSDGKPSSPVNNDVPICIYILFCVCQKFLHYLGN